MSVEVSHYTEPPPEWEAFVRSHPAATFFHQPAWLSLVREVYGGEPAYLMAREGGEVVGLLPLMERKVLRVGRVLASVPYADHAGVCAATPEAEEALIRAARDLGHRRGVAYVELRHLGRACAGDFPCDDTRVVLQMPLPASADALWDGFSSNMRKKIRRSERDGLSSEKRDRDAVPAFYDVYATNMRDLGSPMHSIRFFQALYTHFPDHTLTLLIRSEGRTAAAAIAVWFRDTLTVLCAHALRAYHRLFPNNLLYWRLFQAAIERGCTVADFGRSPKGTGIYDFKKGWGMEEQPLCYSFIPIRSQPHLGERREGLAYALASRLWRRTPLPIARTIGPWVFARLGI